MDKKNIAIILHKYSIVVKGVERKLKELGYNVAVVEPIADLIKESAAHTDLFVMYLPKDSKNRSDDEQILKVLMKLCDTIQECKKNLVVIGEKSYRDSLIDSQPILSDCEWVDRPVDMKVLAQSVENVLSSDGQPHKKQILIVDDDPTYAGMVKTWIKEFYNADILTEGKQVFAFLNKKKVDLILLDYEMPVMDGSQVLKILRHEPSTKDIPVVFLTGVGTADEVKQVVALKPDGYILKSTAREQLLEYLADQFR
ncbi:MAG: response regulator [Selenomonadaceae bacterium]|nr:response regulator [Selenomonadaceae bacterium]